MKLRNVSASQVTTYKDCPRAWHFNWIRGFKGPPTLAMQRGTHVHKAAEHALLNDGEIVDSEWGRYAKAMLPHLPYQHPDLIMVEHEIWMDTAPGLPKWLGYIDLIDNSRMFSELMRVTDHKTTSDFRYAKTPEELKENIQLISYAQWVFVTGFEEEFIDIGHLYIKTAKKTPKNPRTKAVYTQVDQGHVASVWERNLVYVEEMVRAAEIGNTDLLEPKGTSTGLCKKYGGCPHRHRCGIQAPANLFRNRNGNGKGTEAMSSFLEKLKKKKVGGSKTKSVKVPTGVLAEDSPDRTTPVKGDSETEPEATEEKKTTTKKKKASTKKKKSNGSSGFTLFIDCIPVKNTNDVDPTLFDDWFATIVTEVNTQVSEEKNLPDYRLLPYAEEKAILSAALNGALGEMPPIMIVTSSAPGAKDALPVLIPHAACVVRGLRG